MVASRSLLHYGLALVPILAVAVLLFGRTPPPGPTNDDQADIALALCEGGKADRGKALLAEVLARDPGNIRALTDSGLLAMADGHFDEAEHAILAILERKPGDYDATLQLAKIYTRAGKTDLALETLSSLEKSHPNEPVIAYNLGMIAFQRQDSSKARTYLKRYLELAPKAPDRSQVETILARLDGGLGR